MASNIDSTKPTYGKSYTSDVRQNFQFAKNEIEILQSYFGNGPWLPLSGGQLTGSLRLSNDPILLTEAATKQYVDAHIPNGKNLPTSNSGLQPGTLWNNGGFVCVA